MRKAAWVLFFVLASIAWGQERGAPAAADVIAKHEPPALAWIKANAVPFKSNLPTEEEWKPMLDGLVGARVIGIGEPTHGDAESQAFKGHLIRQLVRTERIDTLILEINREPGAAFDTYVNEGKGDLADLMANSGLFGIWRTDEFAAMMGWLRGYVLRTGKKVRIYGVDCQDLRDVLVVQSFLERHDRALGRRMRDEFKEAIAADARVDTFYAWIKTIDRGIYDRKIKFLDEVKARFESQSSRWGKLKDFDEATYALRTTRQAMEAFEFEIGTAPVDYSKVPSEYWARRDRSMAENTLRRVGAKGRAAIWAHDSHVVGSFPDWIAQMGAATLGTEVRKVLKDQYVAIGFSWTEGRFHSKTIDDMNQLVAAQKRDVEAFELPNNRPGDLGEFFARVGPRRFYVDFRKADEPTKAWGQVMYYRGWAGWGLNPKNWQTDPNQSAAPILPLHDILVYFREISPSNLWNLPKKPE